MEDLAELMRQALPAQLFAYLSANEIASLRWYQTYERDADSWEGLNIDFDFSDDTASETRIPLLAKELQALLSSIPLVVMVELFGDNHDIFFYRDHFSARHDYGDEWIDTPCAVFVPDPATAPLTELLLEFGDLQRQSVETMKLQLRQLQEENAELSAFRWVQYAPYFNDGDTCVFGLQEEPSAAFGEATEDFESFNDLAELLQVVHPAVLLKLFGNHKQVTLRGEAFTVEEYTKHH